jgi:hypothetical protein
MKKGEPKDKAEREPKEPKHLSTRQKIRAVDEVRFPTVVLAPVSYLYLLISNWFPIFYWVVQKKAMETHKTLAVLGPSTDTVSKTPSFVCFVKYSFL